jgi:hypothetical protein
MGNDFFFLVVGLRACLSQSEWSAEIAGVCGIELGALRVVAKLGGGPINLCSEDCGDLLDELAAEALKCSESELQLALGSNARETLEIGRQAFAKCHPPSKQCMTLFRSLERWEASVSGRVCLANAKDIRTDSVPAHAQAHSQALCSSDACGGAMSAYLQHLEMEGCENWRAYRMKRTQYDLTCYTASDAVGDKEQYCSSIFNIDKFRQTARNVSKAAGDEATYDAALTGTTFGNLI